MKILDYTKIKPTKENHIIKCPDCGRNGEVHKYTDGSAAITHAGHLGLLGFFEVTSHCYITNFTEPKGKD